MSADPEPPPAPPGPALARWLTAAVALALLLAATAAVFAQRGPAAATTDVTAATATALATTSEAPAISTPRPLIPTATPSPVAPPPETRTPTQTPTPEPTPPPPPIALHPGTAGVGETFSVAVYAPQAGSATVTFLDQSYPLGREPDGVWFGVIGVPLWATLGQSELRVLLRDDFGTLLEERSQLVEVTWVERPVDYLTLTEEQGSILTAEAAAEERAIRASQFLTFDRGRRWPGLFRLPVDGITTTEFGQGRSTNGGPVTAQHSGTDIANVEGTTVHAAAPGRVVWAGEMPIRGNSVLIDHGDGVITGYHHLLEIFVAVDDEVTAQTMIAAMGSTGLSTGPHLHWELSIYGVNVDPMTWTRQDFTP